MTDIVSYRGPDDEGALRISFKEQTAHPFRRAQELGADNSGHIFLGHRRLSILDLSPDGHQPMSSADRNLWITFNGEIYNYIEIREELKSYGYVFKTGTDTEVILAAYSFWGKDCLQKFNGMWAFVIADMKKGELWGACDRWGVKPIYYYSSENSFAFSSEVKQILTLPWLSGKADVGTLFDFLAVTSETDSTEQTMFKGIKRLRGGMTFTIPYLGAKNNGEVKLTRWYDVDTVPREYPSLSESTAIEQFKELFLDSVRLRLRSDVPVGTALSGGLDSSGIVCVMDQILKARGISHTQKTFTIGSELSQFDETNYAREVLQSTNAQGYFYTPNADELFKDIQQLIFHLDYPFQSSSCYASWCVYKLARNSGVTVTLDGQGADETLGGYYNYMYPFLLNEYFFSGKFGEFLAQMQGNRSLYKYNYLAQLKQFGQVAIKSNPVVRSLYEKKRITKDRYLNDEFLNEGIAHSTKLANINNATSPYATALSMSFSNKQKDYMLNSLASLLRVVDRNSMAHSIEARTPFLDYRLVEFIFSLPHSLKIRNGLTKYIYREAMKGILPERVRTRIPKLGFVTAERVWMQKNIPQLHDFFRNEFPQLSPLLSRSGKERLMNFKDVDEIGMTMLWKLLSVGMMMKNHNLTI
jgi:asparagine synthase (glutamine-hydrolysing)